ncbi:hypothetical protein ACN38_g11862 [Penicillium nordicum]|uniref:Uncharacterized protein n=1 Tax=Penicillium nordicum TaxID=229535 RepID=A0A0M8NU56_9EURO|nr:hypothetical protein ACN38_g11862 [Penicillium nordicum]
MLQEGSNELDGEVITNERVMYRMAYVVARTRQHNHPCRHTSKPYNCKSKKRWGLGGSQTWLTAADPDKLVQKYNSFLHGNPF